MKSASILVVLGLCATICAASVQCPPSDEDAGVVVEPFPLEKAGPAVAESLGEGEPVAAFVISGTRPKRVVRVGLHLWSAGEESPDPQREGYGNECQPFEHLLVIVLTRHDGGSQVGVSYVYDFEKPFGDGKDGSTQPILLQHSPVAPLEVKSIPGRVEVPLDQDLAVWGLFSAGVPQAGEGILDTAKRSDSALVVHLKNSRH